jgi:uncharacterized protein
MKLHLSTNEGLNSITGHGPGFVMVNRERIGHPLIVMPEQLVSPWVVASRDTVSPADFAVLVEMRPELVIFGSGATFRFPDPRIAATFSAAGIGFDVMDTPAGCRTYNVLMSEGRNVAAALLV